MRKLMLIIAIATMAVVANAQNKVTTAKTTPEMVYYYTDFSVTRVKDITRGQDVFNYITSQGWELWLHDDNYNIIQRWIIRKKVTKQMFEKLTKDEMKTTTSIELIPSAVDELIKKTR